MRVGAGAACLLAACTWLVVRSTEPSSRIDASASPPLSHVSKSGDRPTEVDLIARRVELGRTAIATQEADPSGAPVPSRVPERELIGAGWKTDPDPAMRAFATWTARYITADADGREVLVQEGVTIAEARRTALESQIAKDPRRALANAVPLAVRDQLPPSIVALLEDRVDGFGDISLLHAMAVEGGSPIASKDRAAIDGQFYEAFRYGDRTNVPYAKDASLHGIVINNKLAMLDSPVRVLEEGERLEGEVVNESCPVSGTTVGRPGAGAVAAGEKTLIQVGRDIYETCEPDHVTNVETAIVAGEYRAEQTGKTLEEMGLHSLCMPKPAALGDSGTAGSAGYIGRPPTSLTHGGKNILIMRVQANDTGFPGTGTPGDFNNMVFGAGGFDTRMRRISYNKTWINRADITPVMTLPQPRTYYVGNPIASAYDCNRWITDAKVVAQAQGYNLSDYAQLIVAHEEYDIGSAGLAWAGYIFLNGYFGVEVALHEYGHTFWLPHANSWHAGDGNPISATRQHREYGDAADPMGNAWGANQYNSFNPYYKNICGWLPDSAIQAITKSGTYRVYQHDGATDLNRINALKLGRDQEFNYWIGIHGDPVAQGAFNNGVAVYAVSSWRQSDTHLLDINDPGDGTRVNAPLGVNQSWYDANADVTLKTVAVGGTNPNRYADVQVTFGPRSTGGYRPLVSGGVYRLKCRQNGLYLDVPNNSNANAVSLQMHAGNNTQAQNWVIWRNSDGTYSLNHQGTDKWIDVYGGSNNDGADIVQHTGNSSDAQRWYVTQNPSGYIIFTRKGTEGKTLDAGGNNNVHQWGFNAGPTQEWYAELMGITHGTYRMTSRHAQGQALDVYFANTTSGAEVKIHGWNAGGNQQWSLSAASNGRLRITPTHAPGMALEVANGSDTNGGTVRQWTWNDSPAQRWNYSRVDGSWLRFTPDCATTRALEVAGDDNQYADGSRVQIWEYTGAQDHQWRFIDVN